MKRIDKRGLYRLYVRAGLGALFASVLQGFALIQTWHHRHQSSRQLARVDARVLRDAGISEAQRFVAVNKPFWRR